MKSATMVKKICALLLALGAFGTVMASATPVDAQALPSSVTWYQKNRRVNLTSNFQTCWDIRVSPETSIVVPIGEWRGLQQAWFTCSNGTKTLVAHLISWIEYRTDGWTQAQYELRMRVEDAAGSTWCTPSVWANPHINRRITGPVPKWWSQLGVESARPDVGDSFRYANCGAHGTVGAWFRLEEGMKAG